MMIANVDKPTMISGKDVNDDENSTEVGDDVSPIFVSSSDDDDDYDANRKHEDSCSADDKPVKGSLLTEKQFDRETPWRQIADSEQPVIDEFTKAMDKEALETEHPGKYNCFKD